MRETTFGLAHSGLNCINLNDFDNKSTVLNIIFLTIKVLSGDDSYFVLV
jgi:hypothetical protein